MNTVDQTSGLNFLRNTELKFFSSISYLLQINDSKAPQPGILSQALINSKDGGSLEKNGMITKQPS